MCRIYTSNSCMDAYNRPKPDALSYISEEVCIRLWCRAVILNPFCHHTFSVVTLYQFYVFSFSTYIYILSMK